MEAGYGGQQKVLEDCLHVRQTAQHLSRRSHRRSQLPRHTLPRYSLAVLRYNPERSWVSQFQSATAAALPNMSAFELCNTLWGLAKLHKPPDADWLARFYTASARQWRTFRCVVDWDRGWPGVRWACNPLWGLAKLHKQPDANWLARFYTASARQ